MTLNKFDSVLVLRLLLSLALAQCCEGTTNPKPIIRPAVPFFRHFEKVMETAQEVEQASADDPQAQAASYYTRLATDQQELEKNRNSPQVEDAVHNSQVERVTIGSTGIEIDVSIVPEDLKRTIESQEVAIERNLRAKENRFREQALRLSRGRGVRISTGGTQQQRQSSSSSSARPGGPASEASPEQQEREEKTRIYPISQSHVSNKLQANGKKRLEQNSAPNKRKRQDTAGDSITPENQVSRAARRPTNTAETTADTSSMALLQPKPPIISENKLFNLMKRMANSVHMIEQLLWAQYGTQDRVPPTDALATSYWIAVMETLNKSEQLVEIPNIQKALEQFNSGSLSHPELMHAIAWSLAGHDRMIMGFDMFLPPQYSMTNLLVLQKLAVALVFMLDKAVVHDVVRQRNISRYAMVQLMDAFISRIVSEPVVYKRPIPSNRVQLPEVRDSSFKPIVAVASENHNAEAAEWIDSVGEVYGASVGKFESIMKILIEMGDTSCVADRMNELTEALKSLVTDPDLLKRFESFSTQVFGTHT